MLKSISSGSSESNTSSHPASSRPAKSSAFSIDNIVLGQEYEGYVKLTYNYGIFVTVKGVEGLLHKSQIKTPDGVDRKKYYNPGDKIIVLAHEFKDINGEKRIVRSQR